MGANEGQSCDGWGRNASFPAPGGDAGTPSLDCLPSPGKNVGGAGLQIDLIQRTGRLELESSLDCGFPYSMTTDKKCPCRQCTGDTTVPCSSDADCVDAGGTCSSLGSGMNKGPNECDDGYACVPTEEGSNVGMCATGPDSRFCDAILRADGAGFIGCQTDADCAESTIGVAAGACTMTTRRACHMDTLVAEGAPSTGAPLGAAIFCIPPTGNAGINGVAGLPGAARLLNQSGAKLFCASDPTKRWYAGIGGCE